MLNLMINGDGAISVSLAERLVAHGHEVETLRLPEDAAGASTLKDHFERLAETGRYYKNVYIDLTDGFDEIKEFEADPDAARLRLDRRLKETLKALKYGAQHLARSDGGGIWVLCYDHSVNFSIDCPSNPITNFAAMAAVQSIAKEVARLDVKVNLFLIHPPAERVDPAELRKARNNLNVYRLKYKPEPAAHISETLHMYAELKHLSTTGVVIPLGSGIAVCNI